MLERAVPDLKGVNQEGVFLIRNYADGVRINDSTITKSAHSCIIAGAGLIGLEMVEAFKKRGSTVRSGMHVTLVEMADHVLPTMLDKNMAKIVERALEDNGVRIILGERVEEILGVDGQVNGIKTNTKRERKTDNPLQSENDCRECTNSCPLCTRPSDKSWQI